MRGRRFLDGPAGVLHVSSDKPGGEEAVALAGAVVEPSPKGPTFFVLRARTLPLAGASRGRVYVRTFSAGSFAVACLWVALLRDAATRAPPPPPHAAVGSGGGAAALEGAATTATATSGTTRAAGAVASITGVGGGAATPDAGSTPRAAAPAGGALAAWVWASVADGAIGAVTELVGSVPVAGPILRLLAGVLRACRAANRRVEECAGIIASLTRLARSVAELEASLTSEAVGRAEAKMAVTTGALIDRVNAFLALNMLAQMALSRSFREDADDLLDALAEARSELAEACIVATQEDLKKLRGDVAALISAARGGGGGGGGGADATRTVASTDAAKDAAAAAAAAAEADEALFKARQSEFLRYADTLFGLVKDVRATGHPLAVELANLGDDLKEARGEAAAAHERLRASREAVWAQAEGATAKAGEYATMQRNVAVILERRLAQSVDQWMDTWVGEHPGRARPPRPEAPYVPAQIASPAWEEDRVRIWATYCTDLQSKQREATRAESERDMRRAAAADGTWLTETPALVVLREEVSRTEESLAEVRTTRVRVYCFWTDWPGAIAPPPPRTHTHTHTLAPPPPRPPPPRSWSSTSEPRTAPWQTLL